MLVKLYQVSKVREAEPPVIQTRWLGLQTVELKAAKPAEYGATLVATGELDILARDCVWGNINFDSVELYEKAKETRLAINATKLKKTYNEISLANVCAVNGKWHGVAEAREADGVLTLYAVPLSDKQADFLYDLTKLERPVQTIL